MARDTHTTLVEVAVPAEIEGRATFRLLYEGGSGPVDWPAREIRDAPLVVGRSAAATGLQLDDPRTSRRHLTLWTEAEGAVVCFEDSSTNGTFVNGLRRRGGTFRDGDVVRIGDSFLLIRFVGPQEDDAPEVASLLGRAPSMAALRREVARVAPTTATVTVLGESGTGKELVAREIHGLAGRDGPFVAVNCSAIPAGLAESQLFGHGAGAFTGAREHAGLFRTAHGGTLFLDEVGELPLEVQPKLLRVLEDRRVVPVGGVAATSVDVRILAATNRDLEAAVESGGFRGDLYARIAEIVIRTPPLRERAEDVLALFERGFGGPPPQLAPELVEALLLHPWPFNVRELFKVARELSIVAEGRPVLALSMVHHRFERAAGPDAGEGAGEAFDESDHEETHPGDPDRPTGPPRGTAPSRADLERALTATGGNVSQLARRFGRSRRQIHRWLDLYGLGLERFKG
jgi:DNA-binding NtrC family response regulator